MRPSPALRVLAATLACLAGGCTAPECRKPAPPPRPHSPPEVLHGDIGTLKRAGRIDMGRAFAAFARERGARPDLGETDAAYWFLMQDMNVVLGRALRNVARRYDLDAVVSSEAPVLVGCGEKWVPAEDVTEEVAGEIARLATAEAVVPTR